jgi:hypothetical protein
MARVKRTFNLPPEADETWRRLAVTRSAPNESVALILILFEADEALRAELDAEALELYESERLTRAAMLRAFERQRRKGGGPELAPAA